MEHRIIHSAFPLADDTSHVSLFLQQAMTVRAFKFGSWKGWRCMQKNGVWIPLIASVGVGAATFYTMTSNNRNLGQTMQQMIPLVAQMSGNNGGGQQQAQMNNNNAGAQQHSQSQQLGPYGMS
ncbi:hypothetical protein [Virgibacillus sp. YIM 98842]|uniref:hypothetical protein n=1 Tax=Virgibacillus sp. YIM 98842 TaxID=2663533 RepID=UPI0013DCD76D|nr:hypothetical protein [Virgibacillus sp. YIM 98842]